MRWDKFLERKFILALIFTVTGSIGLFSGHFDSNEYYLLAGVVMGAYALNKKVSGDIYNKQSGDSS